MTNPDNNSFSSDSLQPRPGADVPDWATHREGKGLSLADVFAKTRISTKHLAAIERGDFAALPPPVYTKAFIRQYADLIEIDPQPLLLKYGAFLKSQEDPRTARKSDDSGRPPASSKLRKPLGAVLVVLIVAVALSFYFSRPEGENTNRPAVESVAPTTGTQTFPAETMAIKTAPTVEPAQPVTIPVPIAPQPATPLTVTPPIPPAPLPPPATAVNIPLVTPGSQRLTIKAKETTWISIRIDQQERQRVLLQPGDTVAYTGNQFRMDIGNAGGIDVSLQGKPLSPLGERGQVVHVTLP